MLCEKSCYVDDFFWHQINSQLSDSSSWFCWSTRFCLLSACINIQTLTWKLTILSLWKYVTNVKTFLSIIGFHFYHVISNLLQSFRVNQIDFFWYICLFYLLRSCKANRRCAEYEKSFRGVNKIDFFWDICLFYLLRSCKRQIDGMQNTKKCICCFLYHSLIQRQIYCFGSEVLWKLLLYDIKYGVVLVAFV